MRVKSVFWLPGMDARIQHVKNLVVPRKQRPVEKLVISPVDGGFDGLCRDHNALVELGKNHLLLIIQLLL
jgi:hypothetical protein